MSHLHHNLSLYYPGMVKSKTSLKIPPGKCGKKCLVKASAQTKKMAVKPSTQNSLSPRKSARQAARVAKKRKVVSDDMEQLSVGGHAGPVTAAKQTCT